jgi:hypothetical protein
VAINGRSPVFIEGLETDLGFIILYSCMLGCEMDEIAGLLKKLKGVLEAEQVSDEIRHKIDALESSFERTAFLPISNLGIRRVLARDEVWVILKDRRFRPPPRPTVYMVEELNDGQVPQDQILTVEDKAFRILGEEVLPGCSKLPEDARPIGDGFVFFPQRRTNPKLPSYFLIPPIEFKELDELRDRLSIKHVVSVSPSTLTDQHIRSTLGFPPDKEYATILIGFDNT